DALPILGGSDQVGTLWGVRWGVMLRLTPWALRSAGCRFSWRLSDESCGVARRPRLTGRWTGRLDPHGVLVGLEDALLAQQGPHVRAPFIAAANGLFRGPQFDRIKAELHSPGQEPAIGASP